MSPDFPSVTEVFAQLYPASGGQRDRRRDRPRRRDDRPLPRAHRTGSGRGTGRDDPAHLERRRAVPAARPVRRHRRRRRRATPCSRRSRSQLVNDVFGGDLPGPRALAATLGPAMARGPDGGLVAASGGPAAAAATRDRRRPSGPGRRTASPSSARTPAPTSSTPTSGAASPTTRWSTRTPGGSGPTVTIRLANDAPTDLPADAGGNPFGLPPGTNRQYLSVYSPWELTGAELDGEATGMEPGQRAGLERVLAVRRHPARRRGGGAARVRRHAPRGRAVHAHAALAAADVPRRRARRRAHSRRRRRCCNRMSCASVSINSSRRSDASLFTRSRKGYACAMHGGRLRSPLVGLVAMTFLVVATAGVAAATPDPTPPPEAYPPAAVVNLLDPFGCAPESISGDIGEVLPGSTVTLAADPRSSGGGGSVRPMGMPVATVTATAGADGHADLHDPGAAEPLRSRPDPGDRHEHGRRAVHHRDDRHHRGLSARSSRRRATRGSATGCAAAPPSSSPAWRWWSWRCGAGATGWAAAG